MQTKLCRIAVFYDGNYFYNVSNYYLYQHARRARLSFKGLHNFIIAEVAQNEGVNERYCQIIDSAYFRGRLTAQQAQEHDKLFSDRVFEDVLMRDDITLFQRHLKTKKEGGYEEKGIDVWLALEAFEMTSLKKYDVCVLVAGDADFVPLVNKLNTLGSRVMLIAWDFSFERDGRERTTRASSELIERVNYPVMMDTEIDSRERRKDPLIDNLFIDKPAPATYDERPVRHWDNHEAFDRSEKAGTIINLVAEKGFGFIKPDVGGDNYFFHFNDLMEVEPDDLSIGLRVLFMPNRSEKGLVANDVSLEEDRI